MYNTLKRQKYNILSAVILLALIVYFAWPGLGGNYSAFLTIDGRWWWSQYYEYYQTFPHPIPTAFSGSNHTGLAINFFYPALALRIIEAPLIMMHILSPYHAIMIMMFVISAFTLWILYLLTKAMKIQQPFFMATFALLICSIPVTAHYGNSMAQYISYPFLFLGVYALIKRKYIWLTLATFFLLTTSFTTSMIAAFTFFLVLLIQKEDWRGWLSTTIYGLAGLIASLPLVWPILYHIHQVQGPTNEFYSPKRNSWFFLTSFFNGHWTAAASLTISISTIVMIWIIAVAARNKYQSKLVPIFFTTYIIITMIPKISGFVTTPIQPGTWFRLWPTGVVLALYMLQKTDFAKKGYWTSVSALIIMLGALMVPQTAASASQLANTDLGVAIKHKDWGTAYTLASSEFDIHSKTQKHIIRSVADSTADMSPDYIPKSASKKANEIAYLSPKHLKTKYGVSKKAVDQGHKLVVTVDPKHQTTPLAVWHYDFIHYKVKTTAGSVRVSKDGMYEYHGTKKATITISNTYLK